ncbi:hypothetical protein EON65_12030 [archaeon]|nr:MAG: hypothetical protein EON65_12030 [archaeon]
MANATYDVLWQQAIGELGEQLHVEGADEEDDILMETGGPKVSSEYIRYTSLSPFSIPNISFPLSLLKGRARSVNFPSFSALCMFIHQISSNLPQARKLL